MHDYHRFSKDGKYFYSATTKDTGYKLTFNPLVYAASVDAIHVSFVYHFGTKLANRYKNRNLIDNEYRLAVEKEKIRRDSIHTEQVKEKRIKMDSLSKADYERRFEEQRLELERAYSQDSLKQVNKALKEKQLIEREEEKHRADSLKEVARIKAMQEKANAKITADSLKFVEKTRQLEEKENAKRKADSLKYAAQERARELKEQKAIERANAKRTADSIKVAQKMEKQQKETGKEQSDNSTPKEDVGSSETQKTGDMNLPNEEKQEQPAESPRDETGQEGENLTSENKRTDETDLEENNATLKSPEAKSSGEKGVLFPLGGVFLSEF